MAKRLKLNPKQMCDALRTYRQEARDLLEHKESFQKRLSPEVVRKLRIMAIRNVPLAKMEERTGIPVKDIWPVVSDTELDPHYLKAKELILNGTDAESTSMQTGLPLFKVKKMENQMIQDNYHPLRELMIPQEGPLLGEVTRIYDLHNKGVSNTGISTRMGFTSKEIEGMLQRYAGLFPLTRPLQKNRVRGRTQSVPKQTPNEEILGVSRISPSLIDISKVFQERYGGEKRKTLEETAKALGIPSKTVERYLKKNRPLFPEYFKKK